MQLRNYIMYLPTITLPEPLSSLNISRNQMTILDDIIPRLGDLEYL